MPQFQHSRWLVRGITIVMLVGIVGVATLLLALRVEHTMSVTLPTPTGPFAVGRVMYDWVDDSSPDLLAPVAGAKRELLVWMWYPALARRSAPASDYIPPQTRVAVARARGPLIATFLTRDLSKVHGHSIANADVAPQRPAYPVLVMRGGASAEVWNYSTLAEDLASHGYVVVGLDAPYRTGVVAFPDGRVMQRLPANNPELVFGTPDSARRINRLLAAWTGDIAFALARLKQLNALDSSGHFTGRLDMSRIGVFGHSLGGATAAQFCHDDSRCSAGIDIDGAPLGSVAREGIARPFMFLLSDHGTAADAEGRQIYADIESIYDRLPRNARFRVTIRGANHFLFSDDGALLKSHIVLRALRMLGILRIDGRRQLAVTAYCVSRFFDAYLKDGGTSPVVIVGTQYPEIQIVE